MAEYKTATKEGLFGSFQKIIEFAGRLTVASVVALAVFSVGLEAANQVIDAPGGK